MTRFEVSTRFEEHFNEYSTEILKKYGSFSPVSAREITTLAHRGNTVALKAYGDLLFYKKTLRKYNYRDAFRMYCKAADLVISEQGSWDCGGNGYPLAFWMLGYYLVNYRTESLLTDCETIPAIEKMDRKERLATAYDLASACLRYVEAPSALNLLGRIIKETAAGEDDLALADSYFVRAAEGGYVYACNNLAALEAEQLISLPADNPAILKPHLDRYIHYLTLAADKFEPYAGNRLGLFYLKGEVKAPGKGGTTYFRDHIDHLKAKEYFTKATIAPDANSAWAFFNLIKYFPKEYDSNIDLMNEHMEYIKFLNPEVYNVAIEL